MNIVKVSVIIPVYNVEKYLRQCLDSVVNQTLQDIEIILVDDGSTDSSLDICNEYAQKDERVKVFHQKNLGSGVARNKGIDSASGEFIVFMDSDDYYPESDILETLYNNAKKHNVNICGGSFAALNNNYVNKTFDEEFAGYTFENDEIIHYKNYQFDYGYHRFVYDRQFLEENNIKFPDFRRFQDPPFFVQAMFFAEKFYALTKITYLLREGHKSVKWTEKQQLGMLDGIDFNLKFAKKNKLENLYKNSILRLNQHYNVIAACGTINTKFKLLKIYLSLDKKNLKNFCPELSKRIRDFYLHTIFSLKNQNNHKVLTILGVKFKFRRKPKNVNEYDLCKNMPEEKYPQYLKEWFFRVTGKTLNLENPQTFNEKIQWLKLYDSTPLKTKLADKYLVREYVKEKIGEEYLIPLLGVWQNPDDINFDELPEKFVLKTNHGSGWNIIVKDKSKINVEQAKSQLNEWLHTNYAFCCGLELHYKNIKPLIIAEEYIETNNNDLEDFKFLCFNGQVKYIWVDKNRYTEHKRNIYNIDWILSDKQISENHVYENFANCPKPFNLNKMIEFAKILSKGFSFVRVDFYENNKKMYFGELTFTSASGTHIFTPESFNNELGNLVDLKSIKEGKNSEQHTNNTCGR